MSDWSHFGLHLVPFFMDLEVRVCTLVTVDSLES